MKVISILNPKGGSGKTTLSTNLTMSLHQRDNKVLLVDSDPQGSVRDWHASKDDNPLPLVALDRPNTIKTLSSIASSYNYAVIDGTAKIESMIASTIKASDFVLIPVQPSPYDLWAVSDLVDFIKARQEVTDGTPKASFIITRAIQGTKLGDEIVNALSEYDLKVFNTHITQRQIYPQTAAEGNTVLDSSNQNAILEIEKLTDEIIDFMRGGE